MKISKTLHDQLFKDLLTNFFEQFLEAFFPQIAEKLDFSNFSQDNFLQQELFADMVEAKLHRLDILAKVPVKGQADEDYVIVIVEAQRSKRKEFLARIFRYFALVHIKTGKMVLPIVLYTDEAKWELTENWQSYKLEFAGKKILDFQFFAIKLKNLKIKDYLRSHNTAALALAATMDMENADLIEIKIDLVKAILKTVKNSAEMFKALQFVDEYLWEEESALQLELAKLYEQKDTKENEMGRLLAAIEARGEAKGKAEGIEYGERLAYFKNAEEILNLGLGEDLMFKITGVTKIKLDEWIEGGRQ